MRKIIALGIMLLFIGMTISSSTGLYLEKQSTVKILGGNTLYVGGSGPGNYSTIQEAIDNASDGDTVFVYSKTYYEHNIHVDKSITMIGEDRDTTIIDGGGNSKVVNITADLVHIQEFTIQNGKKEGGGIYLWSNYSKIINNNIKDNYFSGIHLAGISHDNIISNNIITNNNIGVNVYKYKTTIVESENNTISNNTIDFNYKGIKLICGRGEVVTGNTISNSDDGGIWIFLRGKNIIENNNIVSNSRGIWFSDSSDNLIYNNKINNNSGEGISIASSEKNNISNNEISYNNQGISFGNSVNNIINDNNISYNKDRGIFFECTSYENEFLNNRFFHNNIGIHVRPGNFDNIFSNNLFFNDGFFIESYPTSCSNNKVNGKPFIYLEKESNKVLDNQDAGQIILAGCSSITIKNHDLSDTCFGIQLFDCKDCVISGNKLTNNKRAGIHIRGNGNSIIGNNISNNTNGISIIDNNNLIEGNHISNNEVYGIHILGRGTSILKNHIKENSIGIYLDGKSNKVKKNNFILNERDASFIIYRYESGRNKWINNHWDSIRTSFKIISGIKIFVIVILKYIPIPIPIPWINIDFFPAQEPYDI